MAGLDLLSRFGPPETYAGLLKTFPCQGISHTEYIRPPGKKFVWAELLGGSLTLAIAGPPRSAGPAHIVAVTEPAAASAASRT